MRVVVTGAAGFVARHVVADRLAAGWEVVGIDRRPWPAGPGERVLVDDVVSVAAGRALADADVVIHLAGSPGVRGTGVEVARDRWHDNVLASAVVAERTDPSARLLVASSSSVYGGAGDPAAMRPSQEDDAMDPRGGYARSKVAAEHLVTRARRGPGPTTVVRPFTIAGERQRPDMALARWIEAAVTGRPVSVLGGLDRRRDVSDVVEVATAIGRLVDRDHPGTFNLGTGVTHSLGEHLDAVRAATGHDLVVRVRPAHPREVATTWADPGRLTRAVGALRATPLAELVARQVATIRPARTAFATAHRP